jgi:hypothetical protein
MNPELSGRTNTGILLITAIASSSGGCALVFQFVCNEASLAREIIRGGKRGPVSMTNGATQFWEFGRDDFSGSISAGGNVAK